MKTEPLSRTKQGQRVYLNDAQTRDLMKRLNALFTLNIKIPRIRVGNKQTIETLINEDSDLLAKYVRNEYGKWISRMEETN